MMEKNFMQARLELRVKRRNLAFVDANTSLRASVCWDRSTFVSRAFHMNDHI